MWNAIASLGSSILGGITGASATNKTNKTNERIAHEANEYNYRMFQEQNEWNLDQWNRTNEYNTPLAQRQRMEEAGLNPMFYGLDGSGISSPVTAATPAPSETPSIENSGSFMSQSFLNASNILADIKLKNSQADNLDSMTNKTNTESSWINILNGQQQQIGNLTIVGMKETNKLTAAQIRNISADTDRINAQISQINNDVLLAVRRMELDEYMAKVNEAIQNAHLDNERQKLANDLAIGMYNAITQRNLAESQIKYNGYLIDVACSQADLNRANQNLVSNQAASLGLTLQLDQLYHNQHPDLERVMHDINRVVTAAIPISIITK